MMLILRECSISSTKDNAVVNSRSWKIRIQAYKVLYDIKARKINVLKRDNRMKMTKEEFIAGYCERSGVTWEELSQWAMVLPCGCEEDGCRGWVMVEK